MDEKEPSGFENINKSQDLLQSEEDKIKPKPETEKPQYPSLDFWTSRGNMGEKINLLIGLNLLLINLSTNLVQILQREHPLTDDLIATLVMIQEFCSKILMQPESDLNILEKSEAIHSKITTLLEDLSSYSTSTVVSKKKVVQVTPEQIGHFQRNAVYLDKWGIIESIEKLLASYSSLSHLGFPNYYFAACKELHRYEIQHQTNFSNHHEIIKIPAFTLRVLIRKLLREAPAARLLQNLRRMFPSEPDSTPTSTEQEQIQEIVESYYRNISEYLENNRSLQDSLRISSGVLKNYNLGTGDLESRIPNVSYSVVKVVDLDAQNATENEIKRVISSETIILINRLNNSMLENETFVTFLRRLK
ncbi:MAG: hypothetical protein ACFFB2_06750 [Promethearchaeota archaeon]